ncbi:MAG: CBS domain-containing protein [Bythopirellula sp.]
MSQSPTSPVDPEDFQDPLENYDPPTYSGGLEEALAEASATAIQSTPFTSVAADIPVHEAVTLLAGLHIACLLVEEDGKLVGLFTDRDVLDKVALELDEVRDLPLRDVMTTDPIFVFDTDSAGAVLNVMAVSGYRHVPVLQSDGSIIGIVSPQRITKFLRQHFNEE